MQIGVLLKGPFEVVNGDYGNGSPTKALGVKMKRQQEDFLGSLKDGCKKKKKKSDGPIHADWGEAGGASRHGGIKRVWACY